MKMLNNRTIATFAGLALAISTGGLFAADKENRGQLSENDYKFVKDAARGGTAEVELGQLAQQKAANPAVRDFGQQMVADHQKANDQLKEIAARKGAMLPAQLSHHENSTLDRLQKATGNDFDKMYAKDMVKDHETDVKDFESAAKNVEDTDLRAFAQKTLPLLQEHLRMARNIEEQVKR